MPRWLEYLFVAQVDFRQLGFGARYPLFDGLAYPLRDATQVGRHLPRVLRGEILELMNGTLGDKYCGVEYPKEKIIPDADYYALELSADESGKVWLGAQSSWAGWVDVDRLIELREPSPIRADIMSDMWMHFEMPFHVVNELEEYVLWFLYGGNALIERAFAERFLPGILKADSCVRTGKQGFTSMKSLPTDLFRPVPTPKHRMSIIKRDGFRCRICGRRPENHLDIELHVHHIRPHAQKGVTHEENLITLCNTCHRGLDPHYEWKLYDLLEPAEEDAKSRRRRKYLAGVQAYRISTQKLLNSDPRNPGPSVQGRMSHQGGLISGPMIWIPPT